MNQPFNLSKGLRKLLSHLLLLCFVCSFFSSYSLAADKALITLPPIVSRDYVKNLFLGVLTQKLSLTTDYSDETIQKKAILCITPTINAGVDKIFPKGVNELDATTFERRMEIAKPLDSFYMDQTKKCIAALKEKIEQDKQFTDNPLSNLPTVISRDYAKGLLFGILNQSTRDASPDFHDDAIRRQFFHCVLPSFNAGMDKVFPDGVNELDAATFKRRISTIDSLFDDKAIKCLANLQEQLIAADMPSPIPLMDLDDLRTDIASLKGERVRVKAVGYYVMNMLVLKKGLADMSPIIVDISKLQRDQRRQVLQQCGDIMAGCRLAITGTVKQLSSQIQLSAESIEVQ